MQEEQTRDDLLRTEDFYVRASIGKRFANYVVDVLAFYFIIFIVAIILAVIFPSPMEDFTNKPELGLLERFFLLVFYAVYMSVSETLLNGKSLGKLVTKTRAVNLDGSRITSKIAFERGFSRAVPFCALSAFGNPCNPWQDRWTDTMVVNDNL